MKMLKDAYEEAKRILQENRDALDKIAAFLIEKETITGKEFMEILREVQGIDPEQTASKKQERIVMKENVTAQPEEDAVVEADSEAEKNEVEK